MVCSDHGTQPISLRMQMPVWLKRYNYLTLNRPPSAVRLWRRAPGFVRKRVPVKTRSKVSKSLQLSGSRMNLAGSGLIDWSRTKAFVEPITAEALFLNVKGRESKGVVAPDAIEEFLEEMIERALDTEGPDGRQIIEGAIRQDQAYNGPRAEFGPDLVFKPTRNTMLGPALMGGARLFEIPEMPSPDDPPRPVGYHHPDGMVVIAGPGARPGARLAADASDITPTVLRYLGLPVPDDLDGSGIDDAFDDLAPATTVAHTAERTLGDELTAEEAADIEQHLQDLGYIE
jgi:predicted AlkP superfamily phosphohydrolase/phosphomutase